MNSSSSIGPQKINAIRQSRRECGNFKEQRGFYNKQQYRQRNQDHRSPSAGRYQNYNQNYHARQTIPANRMTKMTKMNGEEETADAGLDEPGADDAGEDHLAETTVSTWPNKTPSWTWKKTSHNSTIQINKINSDNDKHSQIFAPVTMWKPDQNKSY